MTGLREETKQEAFDRVSKQKAQETCEAGYQQAVNPAAADCVTDRYSSLRERLRADRSQLEQTHAETDRALYLLMHYPQFEAFIELLGLIPVKIKMVNPVDRPPRSLSPLVTR